MKKLNKNINKNEAFFQREDHHKNLLRIINSKEEKIKLGGGKSALESHLKKGKLFVRDRIKKLIDPDSKFFELGIFT
ncbi:MAG: acyl-CoA carboxylase subunit beta, partial [Bacteroidetes bacterium]|nr:acyl-CoA carboxylase subunit beta [Bacteroidota bacterium]